MFPGGGGSSSGVSGRSDDDGTRTDLLPEGANARTAVHASSWRRRLVAARRQPRRPLVRVEYDQRLHRLERGAEPVALTRSRRCRGDRYADGDVAPIGSDGRGHEHHPAEQCARMTSSTIVRLDARVPSISEVQAAWTSSRLPGCPRTALRWPGCPETTPGCRGRRRASPSATWPPMPDVGRRRAGGVGRRAAVAV
ncbi:hypothetical protein HBB16_03360 [Pseudonocardia sp. MCCB 268]|nr:hypothetical protein [Pseudonocardia cytotoxica]